jgi:hypothetical protein
MVQSKTKTSSSLTRIPCKTRNAQDDSYREPDYAPSDPKDDDGGDDDNPDDGDDDPEDDPEDNDPPDNPPPAMGPAAGPVTEEDEIVHLLHRLGFTDEATTLIIGDHGLSTFDRLRDLDNAVCESLVRAIRKTKSAIDPEALVTVSDLALCNLQLAIYAINHFDRTSRSNAAFDALFRGITPASIADLAYQRKQEEYDAKETPTLPKLTLDGSRVAKSFEALDELLGRFHGISGVPLSSVVRNE